MNILRGQKSSVLRTKQMFRAYINCSHTPVTHPDKIVTVGMNSDSNKTLFTEEVLKSNSLRLNHIIQFLDNLTKDKKTKTFGIVN